MLPSDNPINQRKKVSKFTSDEIFLALTMVEKMESTVELIYHLMDHETSDSFVLMLIKADNNKVKNVLKGQKRQTDMLFEINAEQSLYVMLCQDTQVDGGYHFGQRVMRELHIYQRTGIYCIALEIRSTKLKAKSVIFRLMEIFLGAEENEEYDEIIYKSLN